MATLSKESVEKLPRLVTFGLDINTKRYRTNNTMKEIVTFGYVVCYPFYPEPGENKPIRIIPVPGTMIESVL